MSKLDANLSKAACDMPACIIAAAALVFTSKMGRPCELLWVSQVFTLFTTPQLHRMERTLPKPEQHSPTMFRKSWSKLHPLPAHALRLLAKVLNSTILRPSYQCDDLFWWSEVPMVEGIVVLVGVLRPEMKLEVDGQVLSAEAEMGLAEMGVCVGVGKVLVGEEGDKEPPRLGGLRLVFLINLPVFGFLIAGISESKRETAKILVSPNEFKRTEIHYHFERETTSE